MLEQAALDKGQIARYALMPQLFPRLKKLFGTGFNSIPIYMAMVLNTVRILPNNHPFLNPANRGKFSMFQVLAAAANNITFDRKNLDKLTIFGVILAGVSMIFLQLILCIMALFTLPAFAQTMPTTLAGFFGNANTADDIAFSLLDLVFGIPGVGGTGTFFGSDALATTGITPFHLGMQALFEFYSYGILLVAVIIICYLVIAIVLETAESGVPFGQRYNHAWAPVRLVLFFALLLPIGVGGINLAQFVLLSAAKYGSNLATNGWIMFDATTQQAYLGETDNLIASPITPDLYTMAAFMSIARTCSWAEGRINGRDIRPYIVREVGVAGGRDVSGGMPAFSQILGAPAGGGASETGAVFVRFGVQDGDLYQSQAGAVYPFCGEVSLTIVDQSQPGSAVMQQAYLEMISCLWNGAGGASFPCNITTYTDQGRDYTIRYSVAHEMNKFPDMSPYVGDQVKASVITSLNQSINTALTTAVQEQRANGDWTNNAAMQLGWGGAGIWFNKIAEQNGALTSAVLANPQISKMPDVMEYIRDQKQAQDSNVPFDQMFTPRLSSGDVVVFRTPQEREVAIILNQAFKYWGLNAASPNFQGSPETSNTEGSGNIIIDIMNIFMGTRGLFDMCANTDVHPLAQLSAIGKAAIEHSISAFGGAVFFGLMGGGATLMQEHNFAQAFGSITEFFMTFAGLGLIVGFLLYYILPFLPFIYFFFAVMTWVKSIFEAMVGMPLWALAHLRIDGEGLPGEKAATGYFYILEIFLRPLCILIGFLGGIIIFTALVKVLNNVFFLAISNLSGHTIGNTAAETGCFAPPAGPGAPAAAGGATQIEFARGVMDQFFYTIVYAVIVYMMGLPCFKMVDLVPDNIMRWLGAGVSSFGSQDGDPADNLMTYSATGASLAGSSFKQSMSGAKGALEGEAQRNAQQNQPLDFFNI